jgi:hypothetical protein
MTSRSDRVTFTDDPLAIPPKRAPSGVVLCGTSDPEWHAHPELAGRLCCLPAGHEGFHLAHRYTVTDGAL